MPNEPIYRRGSLMDPLADKVDYKELKATAPQKITEDVASDWIYITGLPSSFTPSAHASSHQNGGSDEVSVTGLSGLLADGQTPLAHATSHQNGGSDEISVTGLSGLLADSQTPLDHATSHKNGGSDEVATATPAANAIPKADGSGTLNSWVTTYPFRFDSDLSSTGTASDTVETDLNTITAPADTLDANEKAIRVRSHGIFAATANTKTIRLKVGGTTVISNDLTTAPNGLAWYAEVDIYRTSVDNQEVIARMIVGAISQTVTRTALTLDDGAAIIIKLTGQNGTAAANDIVAKALAGEEIP